MASLILFLILSKNTTHEEELIGAKEKYVAAKSGLHFHFAPDKSSRIISSIPFGAKVTIEKSEGNEIFLDERYGKWVNVKRGNTSGWIFSGFLCDFEPATIIKPVADFYRDKNRKNGEEGKFLTHFEDNRVSIKNILDNYIVLEIPLNGQYSEHPMGDVVWRYDVKQKNFFEVYYKADRTTAYIFYLNNDKYPDLMVDFSCCSSVIVDFFLGTKDGFVKIDTLGTWGALISMDFKNMSVVIKNKKESKDTLYAITDKVYPGNFVRLESLKQFEKGEDVSVQYITIDDKKLIFDMGYPDCLPEDCPD